MTGPKKPDVLAVRTSHLFYAMPYFSGAIHSSGLPRIATSFIGRELAERDVSFKQLIPYVVLRDASGRTLLYRRKGSGEARLERRLSIGIGGHVEPVDAGDAHGLSAFQLSSVLRRAAVREILEEVDVALDNIRRLRLVGFVNDDSDEDDGVGRVHLGVLYFADLDRNTPSLRLDSGCVDPEWLSGEELRVSDLGGLELWSRHALRIVERIRNHGYTASEIICGICECQLDAATLMLVSANLFDHLSGSALLRPVSWEFNRNVASFGSGLTVPVCMSCQNTIRRRETATTFPPGNCEELSNRQPPIIPATANPQKEAT